MTSPLTDEIRGDWSSLKGTHYHLVYALWSLLYGGASQVMFYQGNDLLAHPAPPPILKQPDDESHPVPLQVVGESEDFWIQLKATKQPWTAGLLLKDNLLTNFIFNALSSQQRQRAWSVHLVTPARIQPGVEEFIAQPQTNSELYNRLQQIIKSCHQKLQAEFPNDSIEESEIHKLAIEILKQLAQTEPLSLRALKAEIEVELGYAYPDREMVRRLANSLLGALLEDAAVGPSAARVYNTEWLNQAAGCPVKQRGLLDSDPIAACTEAIRKILPHTWNANYCIPRQQLEDALQQFLGEPQHLFVLLGMSGAGKSWAVADWLLRVLANSTRLLINGSDLDYLKTLGELIAKPLRPLISADWRDDIFLTRLKAAASVKAHGQLVVVIDDLKVPTGNVDIFRRDLARLVKDSKEKGIKLVFTCQKQVWELYKLDAEILREDIFLPETNQVELNSMSVKNESQTTTVFEERKTDHHSTEDHTYYSFLLSDLTLEEAEAVLQRRLTSEGAERALILLHRPEFAILRNPYLLVLFLEKYIAIQGSSREVPLVPNIDNLLDVRVDDLLTAVSVRLSCSQEDLQSAFTLLVEQLWKLRPSGLTYAQAIDSLYIGLREQSSNALASMKQAGLLTTTGSIRIAEPLIGDRLYAKLLKRMQGPDTAIASELRPEEDAGVVRVLLRSPENDQISFSENLLAKDERWADIILEGLSQVQFPDYRILAFISVLARPMVDGSTKLALSEPLGRLAIGSRRALKWVTQMYLSGDEMERHRGERALGVAIEIGATHVEAALRVRLSQAKEKHPTNSWDKEKYLRWIRDAITPLVHIKDNVSAHVAKRLLTRYSNLFSQQNAQAYSPLSITVDEIQGQVALFSAESNLEYLLNELRSEDVDIRFHRACALRHIAFQQPKRIKEALFDAIRKEANSNILARLLIASHPMINIGSNELLDAIEASIAMRWDKAILTNATLGLLAALADTHPQRVFQILPSRLDNFNAENQACLSDALAYAWWHCAKHIPECREHLSDFGKPNLKDLPEKYHPFALRGAATAQLALIAFDTEPDHSIPLLYSNGDRMLYFVDATDLIQHNASSFVKHPGYNQLQAYLVDCINAEEHASLHPGEGWLYHEAFNCARLALELLIHFAQALNDPLPLLQALPRDWQALRVAWRLLKAGRTEQPLIAFAHEEYDAHQKSRSIQADHEMDMCLLQLACLEDDPQQIIKEQKTKRRSFLFRTSGEAQSLALLTDTNPTGLLTILDTSIQNDDSVMMLFDWEKETRSWRSLLIARVYARMFYSSSIGIFEAQELCQQMLLAVRSLPNSSLQQDYEITYSTILTWLQGSPSVPSSLSSGKSGLQQSHSYTLSLFHQAMQEQNGKSHPKLFEAAFNNRQGWLELDDYIFEDGKFISSSSGYLIYFFPAVRLALASIGKYYRILDPAASFMAKRTESFRIINDNSMVFREPLASDRRQLARAFRAIYHQTESAPQDERLWGLCGNLLIRLGDLGKAEKALKHSLHLPLCVHNERASALYDLACVYARTGREEDCRLALADSNQFRPLKKDWMQKDPDLASVRNKLWFRDLVESEIK